ncbi:MAG: beta-lactamase family protein [Eubacterium sp.]|nr:beta-lactamase family protein [Eubacterium sp.]
MGFEHVRKVMDDFIARKEENGASLVVTKGGEPVFTYSAGLADVEQGVPFTEDTICRAYSATKVVTGVACMLLVERGQLDIGERLEVYMPEYAGPYYVREGQRIASPSIRVRDLLNMTSGIPYPGDGAEGIGETNDLWGRLDESILDGNSMTTQGFAKGVAKAPLMFPAGEKWMYGASADVLGALIERITGQSFGQFLRENILDPLGMKDTAFYVPKEKRDRLAVLYDNAGDHPTKTSYVNLCIYDYEEEPAFQSGGAGLFSTARDFSRFAGGLAGGAMEGDTATDASIKRILQPRTIDFMRENGLKPEQRVSYDWENLWGYGYGNLVRCIENRNQAGSLASVGSFGWDGWTGPYVLIDPDAEISVTLFLQRAGAGTTRLARNVVNAVYGDI